MTTRSARGSTFTHSDAAAEGVGSRRKGGSTMQVGITKMRVALAALFVLAGVGLASLLSPLVSTALATVGQVVNISDHSASAFFAKVDSSGALKTVGTVSGGNVSISAPQSAFNFPALGFTDGSPTAQFAATNATLAFTGFRVANGSSTSTTMQIWQYGETSTTCAPDGVDVFRFLGAFAVPAGETVDEQLTTPQILKPLSGRPYWCLVTFASGTTASTFYTNYSGYVASGTFTPPFSAAQPGNAPASRGTAK